ncbi:MAG: enoyl-CoA hydratase/isomerase family protein [Pseudomonadales bacterium]
MNPKYDCLKCSLDDRVLTLSFNRPDVLNAVNETMHSELASVFYDIALNDEVDVVVLTGEGRAFSAGGDLDMMQRMLESPQRYKRGNIEGKRIVYSLLELEKPIICKLNGDAIGLGATVALLCDVILADENVRIADPHVRVGLVAGDGGALIWPQLLGYARAKEFLMSGTFLTATQAKELGLINHVYPADQLDAEVTKMARQWADGPIAAISWTKTVINQGLKQAMHSIMDTGMAYEALSTYEDAHRQAVERLTERERGR